MNEMLLTVTDVARLLNVCEKTILNWHKSGKLVPPIITPRGWRLYRQSDIEEFKRHREDAPTCT
ncbi:MAG: helix-turn-helix domain-containing protein [Thermoguttaceae bacterium]|jgi:DNA-binding transcriptional MerR regulator